MELFPFTSYYEPPSFSSSIFSSLTTTTTTTKIMNNNNNNPPTAISSLFLTFSIMSLFVSLFFWWIIFEVNWSFLFGFRFLQFSSIYEGKEKSLGRYGWVFGKDFGLVDNTISYHAIPCLPTWKYLKVLKHHYCYQVRKERKKERKKINT